MAVSDPPPELPAPPPSDLDDPTRVGPNLGATSLPHGQPTGFVSHLKYVWTFFQLSRWLRRQIETRDVALRRAVGERDEALAVFGIALNTAETLPIRLEAFRNTLRDLESERVTRDRERDGLRIDLAAAEADRRSVLTGFDERVEQIKAELTPANRVLERLSAEVLELEKIASSQAGQQRSLDARLQRIGGTEPVDEAERDRLEQERRDIESRLAALAAEVEPRATSIQRLQAPLQKATEDRDALAERLRGVREARREARLVADRQIEGLRAEIEAAGRRVDAAHSRKRAAFIDMAREGLDHADLDLAGVERADALSTIDAIATLRLAREAIQARRDGLDWAPVRRVLVVAGVGSLALLLLIWLL